MEAQQQADVANEIRAVANNGGRRHKQVEHPHFFHRGVSVVRMSSVFVVQH